MLWLSAASRCSLAPTLAAAACSALTVLLALHFLQVNPRTYIGSGKVQEIMSAVANTGATTVIFDDELSPGAF